MKADYNLAHYGAKHLAFHHKDSHVGNCDKQTEALS